MNRSNLFLCCVIVTVLFFPISVSAEEANIAARVGDTRISEYMLQDALNNYVPQGAFHTTITREQKDKYRSEVLNQLIDFELLHQETIKKKISIPNEYVEKVVEENIKRFGGKDRLINALKNSRMTFQQFEKRIESIQMVRQLLQQIEKESEPPTEETEKHYNDNKARYLRPESIHIFHVVVKVDPAANEEEWKKKKEYAESILKEIYDGKDFGHVAYEKSEDSYKFKSGDMGFVHRGQFEFKDIEDAAFALKEGEMSEVLKSIHGFHILKAGEKMPAQQLTFDEMKDSIRKDLMQKKFTEKRSAVIERLKKEIPVVIYEAQVPAADKK